MTSLHTDADSPISSVLSKLDAVKDVLTVKRVFGDAYEVERVTVIPVASIRGVGGGGGGEGDAPDAHGPAPVPVWDSPSICVRSAPTSSRDGTVAWSPSIDVMRIVIGGQLVALAGILVLGRILAHHRRPRR